MDQILENPSTRENDPFGQTPSARAEFPAAAAGRRFGLDVARAAAIALVLISHGTGFLTTPLKASGLNIEGFFWTTGIDGVELFFCLSGFLIGGLLLDIQHRNPSADAIKVFLIRRWMRTLPLYYLTLTAFWLFPQLEPNVPQRVWSYVLLSQNLFTPMPAGWFGPSWSLTIEEWSYLLLPILAFQVFRSTRNPLGNAALTMIAIGFAVRLGLGLGHGPWSLGDWDLLIRKTVMSRVDAVAYGVLGAVFADRYGHRPRSWTLPIAAILLVLVCLGDLWLGTSCGRVRLAVAVPADRHRVRIAVALVGRITDTRKVGNTRQFFGTNQLRALSGPLVFHIYHAVLPLSGPANRLFRG